MNNGARPDENLTDQFPTQHKKRFEQYKTRTRFNINMDFLFLFYRPRTWTLIMELIQIANENTEQYL